MAKTKTLVMRDTAKLLTKPKLCYELATEHPDVFPLELLQETVLKSARYSYRFTRNIEGADKHA